MYVCKILASLETQVKISIHFYLLKKTMSYLSQGREFASQFHGDEKINGEKLIYPAASRNQEPILQVLKRFVISDVDSLGGDSPLFLEIASGSGQHLAHFAPHFPGVKFQPSEYDKSVLGSITYYANNCPTKNILPPIVINITNDLSSYNFEENSVDYIYCANLIHISPFECTIGLFRNAGAYLKTDALMITYGPYKKDGIITPDSNVRFDAGLKARDPSWGLRDITELIKLDHDMCTQYSELRTDTSRVRDANNDSFNKFSGHTST